MLAPKITDPEILKRREAQIRAMVPRGIHDPGTEELLDELEQEPGYEERMAELREKIWPGKKPVTGGHGGAGGAPDPSSGS